MIVVDSVGWIEFFVGGRRADDYEKYLTENDSLLLPSIVLFEVYKKVKRERSEREALEVAAHMGRAKVVSLDAGLSIHAADLGLEHKLPMADSIVYATALANGVEVVTSDAHFEGLPDVVFIR